MSVTTGHIHKNLIGKDNLVLKDKAFASPWLHIETAMANGKQIPCIIIYDENLCRDGMFDDNIVMTDKNLFAIPYSDTFSTSDKVVSDWMANVREYHSNKSQCNCHTSMGKLVE